MSNPGDEYLWTGRVIDQKMHDKIMRRFNKKFGSDEPNWLIIFLVVCILLISTLLWLI